MQRIHCCVCRAHPKQGNAAASLQAEHEADVRQMLDFTALASHREAPEGEKDGQDPQEGEPCEGVFKQNGKWYCQDHLIKPVDTEIDDIVGMILAENKRGKKCSK